jgi:hypothetical protein
MEHQKKYCFRKDQPAESTIWLSGLSIRVKFFRYRQSVIAARIHFELILRGQCMPEQRGKQATDDVKSEWTQAYQIYQRAPGDRYDKKKDRTSRIDHVAVEMKLTRKQAKRRIRNYEAWQRNIKKGLVEP